MKSFDSAYSNSRDEVKSQKKALVEQQHFEIVNAMKKEFGIDSFSALDESERESYRAMLHKMWDKETGLTEAGVKFINEGKAPITEKSTPEQVEKRIVSLTRQKMPNIMSKLANTEGAGSILSDILKEVQSDLGSRAINKAKAMELFEKVIMIEVKKRIKF